MNVFRRAAQFLKTISISRYPIKVRRIHLKGNDGLCEFRKDHFLIKINKSLSEDHSVDVLIHEMAHADSWDKDDDIHGDTWGRCYSRLYRLFLEGFIEKS